MSLYRPTYRDKKTGAEMQAATWWYSFSFAGRRIRESSKSESKTVARLAMDARKRELEQKFNSIEDRRHERVRTIADVAAVYLADYKMRHRSGTFATYAIGHVVRHLGRHLVADIDGEVVKAYQMGRLKEKAAPKSVNEEVGFLLRILEERGDAIRGALRKRKALKLASGADIGRAFSPDEQARLLNAAKAARSPVIYPALMIALNTGMRDAEIRGLQWDRLDIGRARLTVGEAKTEAGAGRVIPMNTTLLAVMTKHLEWYRDRFGEPEPAWYVFPWGKPWPSDPARPMSTLKTAWRNVKKQAGVEGRWHDNRHTLITSLAEAGEGDQVIKDIAGHVSDRMLKHYSHIREEARRGALERVAVKASDTEEVAEPVKKKAKSGGSVKVSAKVKVLRRA